MEPKLEHAERVEQDWTRGDFEYAGMGNTHIAALNQNGDGVLVCCKGHETPLTHYHGSHPLQHVLCKDCHTSQILTSYTAKLGTLHKATSDGTFEDRLVRVCTTYGLSHFAIASKKNHKFADTCACGVTLSGALIYFIGDVWGFRRDPAGRTMVVKNRRIKAAYDRRAREQRVNMSTREAAVAAQASSVHQMYGGSAPRASFMSNAASMNNGLTRSNASRRTRSEFSIVDERTRRPY